MKRIENFKGVAEKIKEIATYDEAVALYKWYGKTWYNRVWSSEIWAQENNCPHPLNGEALGDPEDRDAALKAWVAIEHRIQQKTEREITTITPASTVREAKFQGNRFIEIFTESSDLRGKSVGDTVELPSLMPARHGTGWQTYERVEGKLVSFDASRAGDYYSKQYVVLEIDL